MGMVANVFIQNIEPKRVGFDIMLKEDYIPSRTDLIVFHFLRVLRKRFRLRVRYIIDCKCKAIEINPL